MATISRWMATKRELLGNALMREIVRIRIDTLWNMLALRKAGRLPKRSRD